MIFQPNETCRFISIRLIQVWNIIFPFYEAYSWIILILYIINMKKITVHLQWESWFFHLQLLRKISWCLQPFGFRLRDKWVSLSVNVGVFDFLQLHHASRQQGENRQECNVTRSQTQEYTLGFLNRHKYTPRYWNDVCIPAVATFMYEQTCLLHPHGSSRARHSGEVKELQFTWLQRAPGAQLAMKSYWEEQLDSLSSYVSLSHSFSRGSPETIAGWARLRAVGPPPAPLFALHQ